MASTPVFPPPVNPDDPGRGPMVIGITWTFSGLAVITTILRLYVRKRIGKYWSADDWLMLGAMLLQFVNQIFVSLAFHYGMGKHQADLYLPNELVETQRWEWYAVPPGVAAGILGRISICVLLVRLFGVHVWFKWLAIVLTTLGVVMNAVTCICIFVQVQPVEAFWNPFITTTVTSWNPRIVQNMMFFAQSLYALADLTFVIIPIVIVWRLKMALNRRIGLVALLGMGAFICAMSIMKGVSAISSTAGSDANYAAALSLLWATLEQASVVLVGNIAPLRPILRLDFPVFRTIADSFVSLLSHNSRVTGGSSSTTALGETAGCRNGAYHDMEMNTHTLGKLNDAWHEVHGDDNSDWSLPEQGQVLRTDAFSVVYATEPPVPVLRAPAFRAHLSRPGPHIRSAWYITHADPSL